MTIVTDSCIARTRANVRHSAQLGVIHIEENMAKTRDTNKGIREKREEAYEILASIRASQEKLLSLENDFTDKIEKIKTKFNEYKNIEGHVNSSIDNIETDIESINKIYSTLVSQREVIKKFFDEDFYPLQKEYDGENNPKELLNEIIEISNSTKEHQNELESSYEKLEEISEKYNDLVNEYEEHRGVINSLHDEVFDEENGLEALKNEISSYHDNCKELFTNSSKLYGEIQLKERDSNKTLENIKTNESKINEIKKEITRIFNEVSEMYSITAKKAQGGIFHEMQLRFSKQKLIWICLTFAMFLIWIIFPLSYLNKYDITENIINYISQYLIITIPIVFFITFALKNIKIAQNAEEKYTFKSVVAFSIRQEVLELLNKFPEYKDIIISFTIETMRKLYDEPYEQTNKPEEDFFEELVSELKNNQEDE